jgi:hypothetical protein
LFVISSTAASRTRRNSHIPEQFYAIAGHIYPIDKKEQWFLNIKLYCIIQYSTGIAKSLSHKIKKKFARAPGGQEKKSAKIVLRILSGILV